MSCPPCTSVNGERTSSSRGNSDSTRHPVSRIALRVAAVAFAIVIVVAAVEVHHVYFSRANLPDLGPLIRFEFPTIGHVYDANGEPLIEFAREHRQVARYEE